jgi:hypothetical protein
MSATTRQLELIDTLVTELALEGQVKAGIYEIARRPDARPGYEVRTLIDGLIAHKRNRRARVATEAAAPAAPAGRGIWTDVPDGRYAIPREVLGRHSLGHLIGGEGDMIFVRVNTWTPPGGSPVTYVRQLKGAPGAFDQIKHTSGANRAIRDALLEVGPLDAGLAFSRHYTVCARCCAELTDRRSRETGYGPECRGHMGLAR